MLNIKNQFTDKVILSLNVENLQGANLEGANLVGANLVGANLVGANLPIYCKWHVSHDIDGLLKIGCKQKSVADWDAWFAGSEEYSTPRNTEEFERIRAVYEAYKAYLTFLK